MRYSHDMPFGAQVLDGVGTRFRLWAPAASQVELLLWQGGDPAHKPEVFAVPEIGNGWRELILPQAHAGHLYAYRIDGDAQVPDPASRSNPFDVHGPSELIDSFAFEWAESEAGWKGRPWHEAVIYELHVGTFTPEGSFAAAMARLPHLVELGVTAIELMPIADFPGRRGWGYDGVLPYAPQEAYGRPDDLKRFVQAAHRHGLMVMLDVVYNHFGPDGNYLHRYAPQFFTSRHPTPWGDGFAFDGEHGRVVRDFFLHNALYWLKEYRFDGLRFDAVDKIRDDSQRHFLHELAAELRHQVGRERDIHLVLENSNNESDRLGPPRTPERFDAQWNDDFHNAMHVLLTGETHGYYVDFARRPIEHLARCLTEGFAFQGEVYQNWGTSRGQPSKHLPPSTFVNFLQNHDQIGNRARGDRLTATVEAVALRAAAAVQLLAPMPPMLFMGEEFGTRTPFLYFCDFGDALCRAIAEGRRREFPEHNMLASEGMPTPCDPRAMEMSTLRWDDTDSDSAREWLGFYRAMLYLRAKEIVPRIPRMHCGSHFHRLLGDHALEVVWSTTDGGGLVMQANLGAVTVQAPLPAGRPIYGADANAEAELPAWSTRWYVVDGQGGGR